MFSRVWPSYGGKRPFLLHLIASVQTQMPPWHRLRRLHWASVERVIFVCKGNICRSPYAAAKADSLGLHAVSAGLATNPGYPVSEQALRHAALRGLSLETHRTVQFQTLALTTGDLVACMEPPQVAHIYRSRPKLQAQVTLVGFWSRPRRPWIFDPYGLSDDYWHTCLDIIDNALQSMVSRLLNPGIRKF